ncbi:Peptidase family M23 [Cnuella takakiae]|uniref:Peptidase family M23 n=1 Tax=Cnuella takakiae TaxID=1302690 RepID=A0A1M5DCA8_9BACT|nr:peptidoglycan DD-metalloendopeptidase family protein [Cnuella takakiae]OLY94023.1 hypothetical protein BUE76_20630 [Cnuella takakiae]SHF64587.1 Peptidase family M23 [Cnuella takakiae]
MSMQLNQVLSNHAAFHPVVPFNPSRDQLVQLDLTANNRGISAETLSNTTTFGTYINQQLELAGARYGISPYGEHRTIYDRTELYNTGHLQAVQPNLKQGYSDSYIQTDVLVQEERTGTFGAANEHESPVRRLHLGVDIWGPLHTHVMAPLDGIVHSFGFHHEPGHYGAVIILVHRLEGMSFYTLYGHLSYGSIMNLREGQYIEQGDVFAEFGMPRDNGGCPPHLHFQIIQDMAGWHGDYPGVCAFDERDAWMANSPDPELMLNMSGSVVRSVAA